MAKFVNLRDRKISEDINVIFPGWKAGDERVAVFSPHDDDAMIGAGYAIDTVLHSGGEAYVFVFCNGDCGYSDASLKDKIVDIRKGETLEAYGRLGVPADHIVYFGLGDFSAWPYIGFNLPGGERGSLPTVIEKVRQYGITRVLVPNGYREHVDHEAVYRMGAYDAVQACDPVIVDHGAPASVRSFLQYSVWADFDPSDSLVDGDDTTIRANRAIIVPRETEENLYKALYAYKSQINAIVDLIKARAERGTEYGFAELYIQFDPRPKLPFAPYVELINGIK